jgi:ribonuclease VapC
VSKAVVLDSSALLCLLNGETGADRVAEALPSAVIGAVNLAEVVTKLRERGLSAGEVEEALGGFNLDVRPFTALQAYATGNLRQATRSQGLSLGDRACLALAVELGAPALTADQAWGKVDAGAAVEVIR